MYKFIDLKKIKLQNILLYQWLLLMLLSCSSGIRVISQTDNTEGFSAFKTFEFAGWARESDQILSQLHKDRIESAFLEEAKIRGFTSVKSGGDLIVSLMVIGEKKQNIEDPQKDE